VPDFADQLARLLSDELLADLAEAPADEVRARRRACEEVEVSLSYLRRMVQGRLDIVEAEVARRSGGSPGPVVEELPAILAGPPRPPGPGRLATRMEPGASHRELTAELDRVLDPGRLAAVAELPDGELAAAASGLAALERDVSARRRALHQRMDAVQTEIVRRYRSGELSVDTVLP